jgi:hypothetical protein
MEGLKPYGHLSIREVIVFKKLTTITLLFILALSCSKDNCRNMQDKVVEVLAAQLECTNLQEIKLDIEKLVPVNCREKQTGAVCSFIVDPVVEHTLNAAVPKRWGCVLTKTKEQLKLALQVVCAAL